MFLIPVITEGFFKSSACCEELDCFLDRERKLGRDDLVLLLYYISSDTLEKLEMRAASGHAQAIHAHQYRDWRHLRSRSSGSEKVRKQIEALAQELKDALDRTSSIHSQSKGDVSSPRTEPASARGSGESDEPQKPEHEPPTQVEVPARAGETGTAGRPSKKLPEIADPHKQPPSQPMAEAQADEQASPPSGGAGLGRSTAEEVIAKATQSTNCLRRDADEDTTGQAGKAVAAADDEGASELEGGRNEATVEPAIIGPHQDICAAPAPDVESDSSSAISADGEVIPNALPISDASHSIAPQEGITKRSDLTALPLALDGVSWVIRDALAEMVQFVSAKISLFDRLFSAKVDDEGLRQFLSTLRAVETALYDTTVSDDVRDKAIEEARESLPRYAKLVV